jgi:hypothetical protein
MYAAGDREAAAQVLDRLFDQHLTAQSRDPWWDYALGRRTSTGAILAKLRAEIRK